MKTGAGTLTLTGFNAFSGGTKIAAGVLQLGDGTANNGGITGSVADSSLLVFANPFAETFSGQISGTGGLTKVDSGTLTLSASSNFSGGTIVVGGTLQLANSGALGSGGLVINGGLLDLHSFSIAVPSLSGTGGTVSDLSNPGSGTTTLTVNQAANTTFGGTIQNGTQRLVALVKNGSGGLTLSGSNTYAGNTTISGGTVTVANALALENSTVLVSNNNGLGFASSLSAATLGGLSGSGNVNLKSAILAVGNNGSNTIFSGVLSGGSGLTKSGSGVLSLSTPRRMPGRQLLPAARCNWRTSRQASASNSPRIERRRRTP